MKCFVTIDFNMANDKMNLRMNNDFQIKSKMLALTEDIPCDRLHWFRNVLSPSFSFAERLDAKVTRRSAIHFFAHIRDISWDHVPCAADGSPFWANISLYCIRAQNLWCSPYGWAIEVHIQTFGSHVRCTKWISHLQLLEHLFRRQH